METQEVKHYQVNGKYRIQYERSAVKGQDGFKVEANDDDIYLVMAEAQELYTHALATILSIATEPRLNPVIKESKP